MPIKFRTKDYKVDTYYHIYNKGLDSREVFIDQDDYFYFLSLVERYLTPVFADSRYKKKPSELQRERKLNMTGEIDMVAYCLLPNHFHFLMHQYIEDGITKFMRRIMTGYVMYFNKKYKRHGPLFETNYRAVGVEGEEKLIALTKYIHLNPVTRTVRRFGPVETVSASRAEDYPYSSYSHYIGLNVIKWVNLYRGGFDAKTYRSFTDQPKPEPEKILGELVLEVLGK